MNCGKQVSMNSTDISLSSKVQGNEARHSHVDS